MQRPGRRPVSRVRELYGRVRDFIAGLESAPEQGDVLVVTHGGVIRVAEAYCSGIEVDDMAWGPVPNASVRGVSQPLPPVAIVR